MADRVGPSYQRVADDLRAKITSGELAIGDPIPSTAKLMEQYDVSSTVVRRAVAELQSEGLAIGHSGKAVYVQARPADVAAEHLNIGALGEQVAELKAEVQGDVRDALGILEANLLDLYGRLGYEYPHKKPAARPRRARKAAEA